MNIFLRHTLLIYWKKMLSSAKNTDSKVDQRSVLSFVYFFQITPFIFASTVSWVYLCRHLFERLLLLKSITTSIMTSSINYSVFHWLFHIFLSNVQKLLFFRGSSTFIWMHFFRSSIPDLATETQWPAMLNLCFCNCHNQKTAMFHTFWTKTC